MDWTGNLALYAYDSLEVSAWLQRHNGDLPVGGNAPRDLSHHAPCADISHQGEGFQWNFPFFLT